MTANDNHTIFVAFNTNVAVEKVTADKFNDACDWVYHVRASVQSSRNWEVASEIQSLVEACNRLIPLDLKRKNPTLFARKAKALQAAQETIRNNMNRMASNPCEGISDPVEAQKAIRQRTADEKGLTVEAWLDLCAERMRGVPSF